MELVELAVVVGVSLDVVAGADGEDVFGVGALGEVEIVVVELDAVDLNFAELAVLAQEALDL